MPRNPRERKPLRARPNPLIAAGIEYIDYKDTDLLRKFISDRGKIRSRRVTRLTVRQQRLMAKAIKNAREMALLPYAAGR
ncbi:30S ribosomal protein S18 [Streptomyces alkaliphilus]|uniref:Small ribosomal subunit protein bS18 n=1 Tax=Streptomyces alkaliphilus TaxID=1472722 RepID=A0A7W3TDT8_9ACTN|nr:30S ribosomal protein S18 [Streptomyces alkaliphilus]MBB0244996.1 30S ribosomal protein S18 [Streptomyces alkaliphilus]MQS08331.1 30S ribosomal protein S18 [Streptomyces alkaliphilus]